jgi:hypothetical protein
MQISVTPISWNIQRGLKDFFDTPPAVGWSHTNATSR